MKDTERQHFKKLLGKFSKKELLRNSEKIKNTLFVQSEVNAATSIFVYLSYGFEVDTWEIVHELMSQGKTVSVPVIECGEMKSCLFSADMTKNDYGIYEPVIKQTVDGIDLAIVPALAFDVKKARLGKGGGYYDRFLEKRRLYKLGIAFDVQIAECLNTLPHDQRMDKIITEKRIIF